MTKNRGLKNFYCKFIKKDRYFRPFCAIFSFVNPAGEWDGTVAGILFHIAAAGSGEYAKKTIKMTIFFFTFPPPCAILVRHGPGTEFWGKSRASRAYRRPITQTAGTN